MDTNYSSVMNTATIPANTASSPSPVTLVGKAMSAAVTAAGSYAGRAGATAVLWWAYTTSTVHPDE